jgi:ribosomal protein S17E
MGKAMSNKIKSKADIIIKEFKPKLGIEFTKNKQFIKGMNLPLSKLTINLMSGYITRKLKAEKKEMDAVDITKNKEKVPIKKAKDTAIHT